MLKHKTGAQLKEDFLSSACLEAKLLVYAYATLQNSIVAIFKTKDSDFATDSLNKIVTLFANEVGLTGICDNDLLQYPTAEQCNERIDERLRVTSELSRLLLESLVDSKVMAEFLRQLENLANQQKERVNLLLAEQISKNVH